MKDSVSEKKWEVTLGQGALVYVHYETASTEVINEALRDWREKFARSPTRLKRSLRRPGGKHNIFRHSPPFLRRLLAKGGGIGTRPLAHVRGELR